MSDGGSAMQQVGRKLGQARRAANRCKQTTLRALLHLRQFAKEAAAIDYTEEERNILDLKTDVLSNPKHPAAAAASPQQVQIFASLQSIPQDQDTDHCVLLVDDTFRNRIAIMGAEQPLAV